MEFLYALSKELGLTLGIISLLLGVIAWLYPPNEKMTRPVKRRIVIICIGLIGLLIINYVNMSDYVKVPYVEHLEYAFAQNKLNELGLKARPISSSHIVSGRDVVEVQLIESGKIVKVGETITLTLTPYVEAFFQNDSQQSVVEEIEIIPSNTLNVQQSQSTPPAPTEQPPAPAQATSPIQTKDPSAQPTTPIQTKDPSAQPTTSIQIEAPSTQWQPTQSVQVFEPLSIIIDSYEIFYNGFYYQEPEPDDPNSYWFISFDKGVSGTFHYSRPLSQHELSEWGHGGSLYDSNRNEIGQEGNYPHFWSDSDGHFAMQFPKNLKPGTYIYEVYQVIDGNFISTEITFTI